jgi:hypothetical protein
MRIFWASMPAPEPNDDRSIIWQWFAVLFIVLFGLAAMAVASIGLAVAISMAVDSAFARSSPTWSDSPANIRAWFQSLMQPDNPAQSCCGEADAFEADTFEVQGDHYVAVITDGKGILPSGTRIPVPNKKMKWDGTPPNPTGHGIIFIGSGGQVYCYVAPGGA